MVVNWELAEKLVVNWELGTPISTLLVVKKTIQNRLFHRSFKQKLHNNNNNNNNNTNKISQRLTVLRVGQLKQSEN